MLLLKYIKSERNSVHTNTEAVGSHMHCIRVNDPNTNASNPLKRLEHNYTIARWLLIDGIRTSHFWIDT